MTEKAVGEGLCLGMMVNVLLDIRSALVLVIGGVDRDSTVVFSIYSVRWTKFGIEVLWCGFGKDNLEWW